VSKLVFSLAACVAVFSTGAAVAQDTAIATGIDFDMDEAMAPIIQKYDACLSEHRPMVINGNPTHSDAIEQSIAACTDTRKRLMAEANAVLAKNPAWADQTKRWTEIASDFNNTDASGRKLARETDAYNARVKR